MQILRDPVRLMFAFLGSALLMLVFGFGITTDVENIRYTTLDQDRSPESREYLEQIRATKQAVGHVSAQSLPQEVQDELVAAFTGFRRPTG